MHIPSGWRWKSFQPQHLLAQYTWSTRTVGVRQWHGIHQCRIPGISESQWGLTPDLSSLLSIIQWISERAVQIFKSNMQKGNMIVIYERDSFKLVTQSLLAILVLARSGCHCQGSVMYGRVGTSVAIWIICVLILFIAPRQQSAMMNCLKFQ